jgi:hypothetical protein
MITQKMLSNLSCMLTLDGSNVDAIEATGSLLHSFPSLHLPLNDRSMTVQEASEGFNRLFKVMTPSKADIALAAKGSTASLTADCMDAMLTANRPDSIPSDLRIIQVKSWEPEKRVFIPVPAKGKSKGNAGKPAAVPLAEILKPSDGIMMNIPARPVGSELGLVDASAWQAGEARAIGVHEPRPLPAYQHPQRELTQGEQMAAAWLADPKREVKPASRSSRMSRLQARFWDKGDGHQGIQPVMDTNASLRALGRINRAIRFNATVSA